MTKKSNDKITKSSLAENRVYGWVRDIPDRNDHYMSVPPLALAALPSKIDLRPDMPPVYDQGQLGSCTAQAICGIHQYSQIKQRIPNFVSSRLFLYYNERVIEGTVNVDSGAMIRTGMECMNKQGICKDSTWPYVISKFRNKPPANCYTEALNHQSIAYQRVGRNIDQMKGCIANKLPFAFGFTVYPSFESNKVAQTGIVPLPGRNERRRGGHAVVAVGYDDSKSVFIVRNSWGNRWGDNGYCYMPYQYFIDRGLSDDFWVVQTVEGELDFSVI